MGVSGQISKKMSQQQQPQQQSQQPEEKPSAGNLQNAGAQLGPLPGPPAGSSHRWSLAQLRAGEAVVPVQSGSNRFDSQKGMTGFGSPRDVKGKHLKRIWELEYPEECIENQHYANPSQQQQ